MRETDKKKEDHFHPLKDTHTDSKTGQESHGIHEEKLNAADHAKKTKPAKKTAPQETITELQAKLDEMNDKYLRLYSEFDNFRKRTLREKTELTKTAAAEVIIDLLPVIDDFERALRLFEHSDNADALKEGEKLIFTKFKSVLDQKGLQEIKSVGEPFNTDLHDAITNIPAPGEEMKGRIIDQVEKGYLLNGKVIRYAKVVVGQ